MEVLEFVTHGIGVVTVRTVRDYKMEDRYGNFVTIN